MKTRMNRSLALVLSIVFLTMLSVGCGGNATPPPNKPPIVGQPLDPQGNWEFNFTDTSGTLALTTAGQLFELSSPVVTSNLSGPVNSTVCFGSFSYNGQASGVNAINLTLQQTIQKGFPNPITATLVGTIADDQEHMSGTWTTTVGGDCIAPGRSGTWTAALLAPVTGNWNGTLTGFPGSPDLTMTGAFVENVDQTTTGMGEVSGSITLLGSPCFATTTSFNLIPDPSAHGGTTFILGTAPNPDGVRLSVAGSTPDGKTYAIAFAIIHGGICEGKTFTGTLTHQ